MHTLALRGFSHAKVLEFFSTMEECEPSNSHPNILLEAREEVDIGAMESLHLCLKLFRGCLEATQKLPSRNFNKKQCEYLIDKLDEVVQVASSFFELSYPQRCGPDSSWNVTKWVGIFKLLLASGRQIEDFIVECSRVAWVEAAMTLTNVAEYVSSLGFNLELCKVLLSEGDCTAMQHGLTSVEVDTLNQAEVKAVKLMAIVDKEYLLKKVTLELDTSSLAKYLLRRLVTVHPNPTYDEGNILGKLFGWVVSGRHEEQLGRGAAATVYKVMWLGTPVAKKTFFGPENPFFLKEVEILSQLCHPNITSMFCSTMNKKSCSIIMELMDCDLFALIQRRCGEHSDSPPFSISESLDMMLQIAKGVNYLHTKGIIHRDLKSMNILVKMVRVAELEIGYVQAKVVDFGLSKTKERSTTYSCMTYNEGTCRWMAPELVRPGVDNPDCLASSEGVLNYKFKCDVFSFAMVCYEILTGNLPFKDESDQRKIKLLISKGERPELPTTCPAILKALIEKCWIGNAKERPTFSIICQILQYLKYVLMRGLETLPKETGNLSSLSILNSSGCSKLEVLPKEARNCKSLEEEDGEDSPSDNQETSKKPMSNQSRKKAGVRRVIIMTKTDIEDLDDGYNWRKCGRKAVKNSPHARTYYRCATANCPVRKQVERSSDEPGYVSTTYEGIHTHQSSSFPEDLSGSPQVIGFNSTDLVEPLIITSEMVDGFLREASHPTHMSSKTTGAGGGKRVSRSEVDLALAELNSAYYNAYYNAISDELRLRQRYPARR